LASFEVDPLHDLLLSPIRIPTTGEIRRVVDLEE